MAKSKGQTFMFGAVILMISNITVKLIGALFKIPLQNYILGDEGMAYFQAAYDIYVSFYMISTAGIPVAISRMIASSNAAGNEREVQKIFRISYWAFFVIGIAATAIMMAIAKPYASFAKLDNAFYAMLAIAPTLFFICLSSAYRGYFQGLQNMIPTGVSQVIESLGKLSIGLIVGWVMLKRGCPIAVVAAFSISGVTIGVAAATLYIIVFKKMFAQSFKEAETPSMPVRSTKSLLYELIIISIPISLASSIMGLTSSLDAVLVVRRLTEGATAGITDASLIAAANDIATTSYGAYAMPKTLFNMPTTLIYPFAISALPALATCFSAGDTKKAHTLMDSSFRVASIVAFPCALGMSAMARPILSLLYHEKALSDTTTVTNLDVAAPCLAILGLSVFFLGMIAVSNSVLQAYHQQNLTIVSTVCGIIIKFIASYILLGIPAVGLTGAAVGTALCYAVIMLFNIFFIVKKVGYFPRIRTTFLKPFLAALICVVPCLGVYRLLYDHFSAKLLTILAIGIAGVVYCAALLLLRGLNEEDIKMLPKSGTILHILKKAHLLG